MKKVFLGIFVVFCYIGYSVHGRRESSSIVITPPSSLGESSATSPTPSNSPAASTSSTPPPSTPTTTPQAQPAGSFKNGQYTGPTENAYYGYVQVRATVSGGKLTAVDFLQYPNTHATSVMINQQAMPYLQQEAISAQSANVQIISGATFTSEAFVQSLSAALKNAQA